MDPLEQYKLTGEVPDYTDEEIDVLDRFDEMVIADEHPDINQYLAIYPQHDARLRPSMEITVWVYESFQRMKRECPGLRAWHLIGLPVKCGGEPET
jgi:hypothetical protein